MSHTADPSLSSFVPHPSTASGLPSLLPNESLILTIDSLEVRYTLPSTSTQLRTLISTSYLTSHNFCFTTSNNALKAIPLKSVVYEGKDSLESYTSFMGRNPKVKFIVRESEPVSIVKSGQQTSTCFLSVTDGLIILKTDLQKTVHEKLDLALFRKEWLNDVNSSNNKKKEEGFKASGAGIGGIIRRKKEKQSTASAQINAAFDGDLESLMRNAKNVLQLAEKCKAKMSREDCSDVDELSKMLEGMGVVGGVTKEEAGDDYMGMLAREINDWIVPKLKKMDSDKGKIPIMNITDLYVLYNRARGLDFISPSDLLSSLKGAERMFKGFRLKDFGGVKCVVGKSFREEVLCKRILDEVGEKGRNVYGLSKILGVNEVMGKCIVEELEVGEKVCRDEGVEGTKFFKNEFDRFCEEAGITM
ncbi:hypothetical protein TrLO_g13159 [Triparma laevis f. longispina]|nr:hypothetical protein TrLO_g13159 [Triparma laevis f. longispina]